MQITDVTGEPSIGVIVDLLQNLTRATTAQQAFEAFVQRYWRLRPVEHFVGVRPDPSGDGRYKTLFHVESESVVRGGAGELLSVRRSSGKEVLVPFVDGICVDVDTSAKRITVDLPVGLLDL